VSNPLKLPEDFQECIRFHGHVCPGLAIGYAAVKAARRLIPLSRSEDEEIVVLAENDSCSVDAVQVLSGCTLGKGNLILRDWGKQVFTFIDRSSGRAVRVSFIAEVPGRELRSRIREKIDAGTATDEEKRELAEWRDRAVEELVQGDPDRFFSVKVVDVDMPPEAQIVTTESCAMCGEPTMSTRMEIRDGRRVCKQCAG
jgi:formylmethanofuran dehydrogenase subunit E